MKHVKPAVRFRFNAAGMQVFIGGKWIPADDTVTKNVINILDGLYS